MKDIIIVCAGNYASEIYVELCNLNRMAEKEDKEKPYNILGFIDDTENPLASVRHKIPVIGKIKNWKPIGDERYVLGLSDPLYKEKLTNELKKRGVIFETIVARNSFVPEDTIIGEGCIVNNATIGCGVKLGDFVTISGSMLYGGSSIGSYSTTTGFTVVERAIIGKRVFIGSKAVITEGCEIGDDAKISAASVVLENVDSKSLVFGVPAKVIKRIGDSSD